MNFKILLLLIWSFALGAIPPELRHLKYAIYPDSPKYNTERFDFNKRFNVFPQAIFQPRTYDEVAFVLSALKKHNLPFSVRSGGHGHEGNSLSQFYIIDLRKFNKIKPDIDRQEVFVEAGCLLKDVIHTLGKIDYAIPTGTCPTVGATGLTLGGGIGYLCRPFGLTCGSVKSMIFMTADSKVITVSPDHHPDLYWALLGGGNGSYGIVLGFTYTMYHIPEATFYELIWEFDTHLLSPIMQTWQKWVATLPDNITSVLAIRHPKELAAVPEEAPETSIRISGLKIGSEPFVEWKSAFKELKPEVKLFQGTYLFTSKFWAKESQFPFNKVKSRIMMQPVGEKVIQEVQAYFERMEGVPYTFYFEFERFGGQVAETKTSFFPKNAFGWWLQAYYWGDEELTDGILTASEDFYNRIPSEVSKYSYANIVDYDLGKYFLEAYYGSNADRLIEVKRKYDPKNLFQWRQSIPLAKPVPGSLICQ